MAADEPVESDAYVEQIIQLHVQSRGGHERLARIRTMQVKGKLEEKILSKDAVWLKNPPEQFAFATSWEHLGWPHRVVVIMNDEGIWQQEVLPKEKYPEPLMAPVSHQYRFLNEFPLVFINWKEKGYRFYYRGQAEIRGMPCFRVTGVFYDEFEVDFFFVQKSLVLINMTLQDSFAGKVSLVDWLPIGLRNVDGIALETGLDCRHQGRTYQKFLFNEYFINAPVSDHQFAKPEKQEVWLRQDTRRP